MDNQQNVNKSVQNYYGKELQGSVDLKTNACCTDIDYPEYIKKGLGLVHDEVMSKYYGCGLTIPTELKGTKILDLGSGSGRDCYLASYLVGQEGEVVGVDMTDEQLEVASRHIDYHTKKFGYSRPNTKFVKGNIEKLAEADLPNNYFDIIVSNCVVNLAFDKKAVIQEAYNKLKVGGEFYFSDVYSDRRVPLHLTKDEQLYGECLSGALYWNDFLNLAKSVGFFDPRVVKTAPITIENPGLQEKVGNIKFYSVTYRLFKLPKLESDCEDYGHAVKYKGSIENWPSAFKLDDHHVFETGRIEKVCGNSYMMLKESRFKQHFDFFGDFDTHHGIFEGCGGNAPFNTDSVDNNEVPCC